MLFFTYKGGGVTPLTGPPNLNGFSSIIRGGMSIRKWFFLMKASLNGDTLIPNIVKTILNVFKLKKYCCLNFLTGL